MPLIMQYFIVFKAFKALSYEFLYYFTYFFPLVQKNPLGWALKKTCFFNPGTRKTHASRWAFKKLV